MKKKVMVVDDTRVTALLISQLLEGSEFEVAAHCETGEQAISCYPKIQPDVITMDIIMPGIDGLETAQIILEEHPEARIIMISSLMDQDHSIQEALSFGVKTTLDKSFGQEELFRALEQALA